MKKQPLIGLNEDELSYFGEHPHDSDNPSQEQKMGLMDDSSVYGFPYDNFPTELSNENKDQNCFRSAEENEQQSLKDKEKNQKQKKSNTVKNFSQQVSKVMHDEIEQSHMVLFDSEKQLIKNAKKKPTILNFDILFQQGGNLIIFLAEYLIKRKLKRSIIISKMRKKNGRVCYNASIKVLQKNFVKGAMKGISVRYSK